MGFQSDFYSGNPANFELPDGTPLNHAPGFAKLADGRVVQAGQQQYNGRGELNAYDDRDHAARVAATADQRLKGRIRRVRRSAKMSREQKERFTEICKVAASGSKENIHLVADTVSDTVYEVMRREGLSRNLLGRMELGEGEQARIEVDKMDVMAFLTLGNSAVTEQLIEADYLIPAEGEVACRVEIPERVLALGKPSLLDRKYETMLDAIGVREDRMLKFVLDLAAPSYNNVLGSSTFTPAILASMKQNVGGWGLPTSTCLISYDVLADMQVDPEWTSWFDPGTKHLLALEGYLEQLMGVEFVIDGFRYENLKVLNQGEAYLLSTPAALGTFTERGKLVTKAIDGYNRGMLRRGWISFGMISHTIGNGRAVCRWLRQ